MYNIKPPIFIDKLCTFNSLSRNLNFFLSLFLFMDAFHVKKIIFIRKRWIRIHKRYIRNIYIDTRYDAVHECVVCVFLVLIKYPFYSIFLFTSVFLSLQNMPYPLMINRFLVVKFIVSACEQHVCGCVCDSYDWNFNVNFCYTEFSSIQAFWQ